MVAAFPESVLGAALEWPCLHHLTMCHCTGRLRYVISCDNLLFFFPPGSFIADAEVLVTRIFSLVLTLCWLQKCHACARRDETVWKDDFPHLSCFSFLRFHLVLFRIDIGNLCLGTVCSKHQDR